MIIEAIFSTVNEVGLPNFAPMGIVWGAEELTVRPFRQTRTYRNLIATGYGVANLTDDVLAFVESGLYDALLPHFPASTIPGVIFQDACSWRELAVITANGTDERAEIRCRVVDQGWRRDFLGFNRARNAIVEAAILATRIHLQDPPTVLEALDRFGIIVIKTGDEVERMAFERVRDYVRRKLSEREN